MHFLQSIEIIIVSGAIRISPEHASPRHRGSKHREHGTRGGIPTIAQNTQLIHQWLAVSITVKKWGLTLIPTGSIATPGIPALTLSPTSWLAFVAWSKQINFWKIGLIFAQGTNVNWNTVFDGLIVRKGSKLGLNRQESIFSFKTKQSRFRHFVNEKESSFARLVRNPRRNSKGLGRHKF